MLCALLTFVAVLTLRNEGDHVATWGFVLLAASIVRSIHHRAAGTELLYGRRRVVMGGETVGQASIAGIRRYIVVAVAHTLLVMAVASFVMDTPTSVVLASGAALMVWPAVLDHRARSAAVPPLPPRVAGIRGQGLRGRVDLDDRARRCAASASAGTMVLSFLQLPSPVLQQGPIVLMVLATRHAARPLGDPRPGRRRRARETSRSIARSSSRIATRTSACCRSFAAGGTMLMFIVAISLDFAGVALVICACWVLMAWPLIIRRFFSDRQFDDLLAGDQSPVAATRAGYRTDRARLAASGAGGDVDVGGDLRRRLGPLRRRPAAQALALGGTVGVHSAWWNVGLLLLQAWAGCELIRCSPISRVVATIYAVVGGAVSVYLSCPVISMLRHAAAQAFHPSTILLIMPLASALVLPLATLILVNRKIAPTARARFRSTKN